MSKTKDRIRETELRYRHSLGQHFIYDDALLSELTRLACVSRDEDVLEIGPGSGTLTKHLCENAGNVLAVELDGRMIPLLRAFLADAHNLTVVNDDIMTMDIGAAAERLRQPFAVVANIPYYITTPLITRLLNAGLPISRLALMVQREVADKILSEPGGANWGPLGFISNYRCRPRLAKQVPASAFTPPPKVDSAFVILPVRESPAVTVCSEADLFRIVEAAFALRRKTMTNCLAAAFRIGHAEAEEWMADAGLDPRVRGEKLTLAELARLADILTSKQEERK